MTPQPPKKSGLQWWVILIIVLVVLCCCCVVVVGVYLWYNGDAIFGNQFSQVLTRLLL
jgi:flagellar basal body-associated protein FliL